MFCTNCGKQLDDNAVVCVHCGVPVKNSRQGAPVQGQMSQPLQQPVQPKNTNKIGVAGFAVGTASIIFSVYLFFIGMLFSVYSRTVLIPIIFCLLLPIAGTVISSVGIAKRKKYERFNSLAIAGLPVSLFSLFLWTYFCVTYVMEMGYYF